MLKKMYKANTFCQFKQDLLLQLAVFVQMEQQ